MKNNDMTSLRGMIEQMPTEQLDEMLQHELEKSPADEAAVRLIMGVLEERDQDIPVELNEQIKAAWGKYQAQAPVKERPRISLRSWPIRAVAAIAIIALVFTITQSVEADGFWERLSRWTDSIFEFFVPGDARRIDEEYVFVTDNPGLQQVYDTVVGLGVTDPVVPMWLPTGYELIECEVSKMPTKTVVYGHFSNGSNRVTLDVSIRNSESPRQYSKDENNARKHEIAGIDHNLLQNEEWLIAAWTRGSLECAIAIDCQEETLYKILKSIYTMEAD